MDYLKPIGNKPLLVLCVCKVTNNGFTKHVRANFYINGEIYNTWAIAKMCNYKMSKDENMTIQAYGGSVGALMAEALAKKFNIKQFDILIETF